MVPGYTMEHVHTITVSDSWTIPTNGTISIIVYSGASYRTQTPALPGAAIGAVLDLVRAERILAQLARARAGLLALTRPAHPLVKQAEAPAKVPRKATRWLACVARGAL